MNCSHVKDNGELCGAAALLNQPFCYFHRRYYQAPALPGDKNYQAPLLESNHSIQLALTQLYQSFLTHKLDFKEATFGLQVLRLAAKTVEVTDYVPSAAMPKACHEIPAALEPFLIPNADVSGAPPEENPARNEKVKVVGKGHGHEVVNPQTIPAPGHPTTPNSAPVEAKRGDRKPPQPASADTKRGVWDPEGCLAHLNHK